MVKGVSQNQNKGNFQDAFKEFPYQKENQNSSKNNVQMFHWLENLLADGRGGFGLTHGVKM
jgi:hypothetical protein